MVFLFKERYINLLTDFGFKRVFGTEDHKQLTIDFLNTLLPERHQIQDLTFRSNENLGNTERDRRAIFDIFCEGGNGEQFIVEMQRTRQAFFRDRSVYYAAFPIRNQATKGDWDYQLPPIYTVSVLDFIMDEARHKTDLIHTVRLKDQNSDVFYDKLTFIYIELPKFNQSLDQCLTHVDKWLYLFRHLPELSDPPQALDNPIFAQLFEVAEIANFSPDEQDIYQDALKAYRDFNNVVNTAIQEAVEETREEERSRFLNQQRSLFLRQLTRQVGPLSESAIEQVNALPMDALESLADALLDFQDINDLNQWLTNL